jgi:hypothetical protein
MPARLIIEMVYTSVFWLNSFPNRNGITGNYSPRNIVVGQQIDYNYHCQLEFGTYVQTHEEYDNSMLSRTTGAIALRPTANSQGGYYFMSLTTGRLLNRYNWHVLPMPQDVIDRVHVLARRQMSHQGLLFTNRLGEILDDNADDGSDDSSYHPSIHTANDSESSDSSYQPNSAQSSSSSSVLGDQTDGNSDISSITDPFDTNESVIAGVNEDQEEDEH